MLANEDAYTFPHHTDIPGRLASALNAEDFLTDGFYGVQQPLLANGSLIYAPSQPGTALSTGRLVQSPSDIVSYIDMYLGLHNHTLKPRSAFVDGYDFLTSEADDISNTLATALLTPTTLINDSWSNTDLTSTLFASSTPYGLVSLNSHFDDNTLFANAPLTSPLTRTTVAATAITATTAFSGALVFSVGCHSGLDTPDDGLFVDRGWPRAFMQSGATYVGNTGYGYGATDQLGYSAQLMSFFARNLNNPNGPVPTVGSALDQAKEQYLSAMLPGTFNVIDKKVLQEATLYGLPMVKVALPNRPDDPLTGIPALGSITTTAATPVSATFTLGQNTIPSRGQYETIQTESITAQDIVTGQDVPIVGQSDVFAGDNRPAQPRSVISAASPGATAHGVLVTGGTFTDNAGFQPVVESIVTDQTYLPQQIEPLYVGTQFYPALPASLNLPGQSVVLAPGQFMATAVQTQTVGTERTYSALSLQVFNAPATATDFTPPVFGTQQPSVDPLHRTVQFSWQVVDDSGALQRVLVLYARLNGGPTTWSSVDLTYNPATGLFIGGGPLPDGTGPIEYFAQAVDPSGNVGHSPLYQVTDAGTAPPSAPPLIAPTPTLDNAGANGWFRGAVTLNWTVSDSAPIAAASGCGSRTFAADTAAVLVTCTVTSTDGLTATRSYSVQVDTAPPTTSIASGPTGFTSGAATVTFAANDNPTGSGVANTYYSVDGGAPQTGTSVSITQEGVHTLAYWSVDNAGNVESAHTTQVEIDKTAPNTAIAVPAANANGWYNRAVTATLTSTDNLSGVAATYYSLDGGSRQTGTSITISTEGSHTLRYWSVDNAGNIESAHSVQIKIDRTAPAISISAPISTTYLLHQAVAASYTCGDPALADGTPGSGTVACLGTVASGKPIDTRSVGAKIVAVGSVDAAGNASYRFVTYVVAYNTCLLYDPTQARPSGSTMAVKLQLCDANRSNVSSSSVIPRAISVVDASGRSYRVQSPGNSQPDDNFTYMSAPSSYQFNLKTSGLAAGSYTLDFTVGNDPTVHTAPFTLK